VLLLFPEVTISTATVFNSPTLNRQQTVLPEKWIKSPGFWINDCLPVVLNEYSTVNELFGVLSKTILLRMSGTGSTLFALFKNKEEAISVQKKVDLYCRHALIKI
jgi:4-diphosphocytidyl-2-C-methyl-D-erythritol kinase